MTSLQTSFLIPLTVKSTIEITPLLPPARIAPNLTCINNNPIEASLLTVPANITSFVAAIDSTYKTKYLININTMKAIIFLVMRGIESSCTW